jgi:hypothetical protein
MPPPLPDRYRLEVRIGRDGDIEEWLATDTQLDRPVLVRVLGPESSEPRRARFVEHTRAAAGVTHQHVARVYEVGNLDDGAYSISEWPGGIRLADRGEAGLGVDLSAFLPNAEGLARGLAALHGVGVVHGSIDAGAVFFSAAHPAKLAAFGRTPATESAEADVRALAAVLEEALTGRPPGSVPPSEVIDGLSTELDVVFATARNGSLDAEGLAERFTSVPAPTRQAAPIDPGRRSWWVAAGLLGAAALLIAVGTTLAPDPVVVPDAATSTTDAGTITVTSVDSYDPLGDGIEGDRDLSNLVDGDPDTTWSTDAYSDPFPLVKAGVGVTLEVRGTPSRLRIEAMSPGTVATLHWRATTSPNLAEWDVLQRFEATAEPTELALPDRSGGVWLVWLVELPLDGRSYRAAIGEITFDDPVP